MLELNYFNRVYTPAPKNQSEIYNDILHIGRTTHDRHLRDAVEQLGTILLKQLRPTIRLEAPTHDGIFLGRQQIQGDLLARLEKCQSISLIGPGGMGKTTLATTIAETWRPSPVFWFTIRHDFNDRFSSLLFAMGYFLHLHGSSGLWLQLVASDGKIEDLNLALALADADLEVLPKVPLFCFDEIDLLRASDIDSTPLHHEQLLTLIESLRTKVPLLLIGQQSTLETDLMLTLDRLSQVDISKWLTLNQIDHSKEQLTQLDQYTSGNPRLLTLCFALHQSLTLEAKENGTRTITFADTLARLPASAALAPIWLRIRSRLSPSERSFLYTLSVFHSTAPADAWHAGEMGELASEKSDTGRNGTESTAEDLQTSAPTASTIHRLIERRLLQQDQSGGLTILPLLSNIVYKEMAIEQREMVHISAANVYATRGAITEAAYHFSQGGTPESAVREWFPRMEQEIQRGQIAAALPIFEEISGQHLKPAQQKQLALIRGMLNQLRGEPEKVIDSIEPVDWPEDDQLSIDAMFLWGKALDVQGDGILAKEKLARGIDIAAHLMKKTSQLHVARGLIYMHERDMPMAITDVTWAHFHAEMLDGTIQAERGELTRAQACLGNAVKLAQQLDNLSALGRAHYYLANAASMQQNFDVAFRHYELGIQAYSSSGNQVEEAQLRASLASNFLIATDYGSAIREANTAHQFFQKIKSPYWSALCANTIAEAYFELGELENAEQYAMEVVSHEDSEFFPYGLFTIGSMRRAMQKLHEAQSLLSQSCAIAEENEDRYLLAFAKRALGEVEADLDNTKIAPSHFTAALALFVQMDIEPEIEKTKKLLAATS